MDEALTFVLLGGDTLVIPAGTPYRIVAASPAVQAGDAARVIEFEQRRYLALQEATELARHHAFDRHLKGLDQGDGGELALAADDIEKGKHQR